MTMARFLIQPSAGQAVPPMPAPATPSHIKTKASISLIWAVQAVLALYLLPALLLVLVIGLVGIMIVWLVSKLLATP